MLSAAGYVCFFQSEIMRICEGKIWKVTTVLFGKTAPKPKGLLWMQLFIYICGRRRYKDISCSFYESLRSSTAHTICFAEQRHINCLVH